MSYTKTAHHTAYPSISLTRPELSTAGKAVLVTGAGSGLGRVIAIAFAATGSRAIALVGRRQAALDETAAAVTAAGGNTVSTHAVDVTDRAGVDAALAAAAAAAGGPIDIVVHAAAALGSVGPVTDADPDDLLRTLAVNVGGTLNVAQAALSLSAGATAAAASPDAAPAPRPIVFINLTTVASVAPPVPSLGLGGYVASKLSAVKLIEFLAAENPRSRFVSVHPGVVETDMGREIMRVTGFKFPDGDDESLSASFVVWAASDEAAFLQGKLVLANWDVDELKARKDDIGSSPELTIGLAGFPRV